MTSPNQRKTLSPSQRSALTELRVSAKRGLVHFSQTINQFDPETLAQIINETFLCYENQEMTLLIHATLSRHLQIVEFLLENCHVNVDATGRVSHLTSIVEGATALWCAAASGYLDIVKMLVDKGATVDHCTTSKSTPLRAACYLGEEAIVQYLIQNGADVNKTNVFNSTCLMLASYKGHNNIVKYLLKNGADVNVQTNCGATAMHFAAQANHITVVKLLLEFNAKQTKNDHSLTPILVAAERTHYELVKYLFDTLNLTRKELIEVEELLGASFLNDKDSYDINLGFALLKHSMEMRFDGDPVIPKDVYKKVEAYNNQVECQNVEDLMKIRQDHSALHYESLIIRERILGTKNADLLRSIIYRGAVYADSKQFLPCLKLWTHAMKISRTNNFSIYKDLLRFTQVFCQMIKANMNIVLSDLIYVMQAAVEEFKMHHKRLKTDLSAEHRESIEVHHLSNVYSTLGLIIIASNALEHADNSTDPLKGDLMKTIVELNRLDIRTEFGQTLLHLCLDYDTNIDNIFTTGICSFPNYHTMKLLIYCGADVNAVDLDNNTPLHNIGKFIVDFPHIPHNSDYLESKKMVIELINAGAHTDFVNKYGSCPHTGYLKSVFNLTNHTPRSLKCLSSIALKNNVPKEFYSNQLPKTLDLFTSLH